MEFLFYIVACLAIMAVSFPLFTIAAALEKLTSIVHSEDAEPVRAHIRVNQSALPQDKF
tara:strand:- start:1154 stop:1330 length:177 start_codon:yes stop_codon:yes gene_type:complete